MKVSTRQRIWRCFIRMLKEVLRSEYVYRWSCFLLNLLVVVEKFIDRMK